MNLSDRAATKAERERLDRKETEDKKAADQKQQGGDQIQIQRGFNENNPVTLEEKPQNSNGAPVVEKGLPPDAQQDQNEASGGNAPSNDYDSAPKKSGKGKK